MSPAVRGHLEYEFRCDVEIPENITVKMEFEGRRVTYIFTGPKDELERFAAQIHARLLSEFI